MRNEDYDRELLVCVTLIVAGVSAVASLQGPAADMRSAAMATSSRAEPVGVEPVRIVGAPFVPNIDPAVR